MNSYLKKQAFKGPIIKSIPASDLGIFVVIPCFNETSLLPVFESLAACTPVGTSVEVLAVVNNSIDSSSSIKKLNEDCYQEALRWISSQDSNTSVQFHCTYVPDLPKKHAGVGLARKIGMDEGVRRFDHIESDGIIVNLDTDCTVSANYLDCIHRFFQLNKAMGCSIHFEHPLEGVSLEIEEAIVQYELYLRYYINMQALIGFPWAYQTIGSAMAVRSSVYQAQGGMNKRKAGEDFYFLQKIIELGNFGNLPDAVVYASPRKSDRVPFGTGKAVNDITAGDGNYLVYALQSFEQLQLLFQRVDTLYNCEKDAIAEALVDLPTELMHYLQHWGFEEKIKEIKKFTTTRESFHKRFFREFNAFQLMKYMHWMRDNHFSNVSIEVGLDFLFPKLGLERKESLVKDLLCFRNFDQVVSIPTT